ncbi:hypothetical protein AWV80_19340 [Cupriavidus sp. UYMU48A]|nr:hypothetical protein AWV80_19340 [Cupriavidus sp. UYMU48A]
MGGGEVLPDLLDQIPVDAPIDTIAGDGAYDSKLCHAAIAVRGVLPSIPPRDGAQPWPERTQGAARRNGVIDVIRKTRTLTGRSMWAREVGSQATEVTIRASVSPLRHRSRISAF